MVEATAAMVSNKNSVLVDILRKSITLQFKNRKVQVTIITIFSILLNSLLLFTTISATKSVFRHLIDFAAFHRYFAKENVRNEILQINYFNEEILVLLGVKSYLSLASFAILVLEMVLETTKVHSGKTSLSSIWISFTCLAVFCLIWAHFGGIVLDAMLRAHEPSTLLNTSTVPLSILVALGCVSTPLCIVWVFAMVIWVNEVGICGCLIEALQKAILVVKGTRLYFFALSFSMALSRVYFVHCLIGSKESNKPGDLCLGFVWTVFSCGMILLEHLSYILEYPQSKKMSGYYYVTLEEGLEYSKISTTPLLSQDFP